MMNNKKNICVTTTNLFIVKFFFLTHLEALKNNYNLTLVVNIENKDFLSSLALDPSIHIVHIPIKRDISIIQDLRAFILILKHFLFNKYDLVITIAPKAGLIGIVTAWISRIKNRIHIFQGEVWLTQKGLKRFLVRTADIVVSKLSTHLLVVSHSEREFLINENIISDKKSLVLGKGSIQGVDLNKFSLKTHIRNSLRSKLGLNDDTTLYLYIGRLNPDKGIIDLIEAFKILNRNYSDTHLLIAGPDEGALKKYSSELMPQKNFTLIKDFVPNPEEYMMAADVLVLPSYREGFGMVIIEAAAARVPAIGSNIYGITDAICNLQTGLLFEKGNAQDLSHKMTYFLDKLARKNMGQNAFEYCSKNFSKDFVIKQFELFIKNILD